MFKRKRVGKADVIVTVIILIALYAIGIYNAVASNLTTDLATMKPDEYQTGKYVEADVAVNLGSYCQEESYRFHFIKTGTADYYVVSTKKDAKDCISLKTNKNTEEWEKMAQETETYMQNGGKEPAVRHIKGQLRKCDTDEAKYLREFMQGTEALGITYSEYYIQETDGIDAYAILIAALGITLVMGLRFFLLSRQNKNWKPEEEE